MRASAILATLRAGTTQGILLLEEMPVVRQLVAAWPSVPLELPADDEECPDDIFAHHVRWLFSRLEPDPVPRWIEVAGLPDAPHIRAACQVAIDNRLVLADGSLPEAVDAWFQARVSGGEA